MSKFHFSLSKVSSVNSYRSSNAAWGNSSRAGLVNTGSYRRDCFSLSGSFQGPRQLIAWTEPPHQTKPRTRQVTLTLGVCVCVCVCPYCMYLYVHIFPWLFWTDTLLPPLCSQMQHYLSRLQSMAWGQSYQRGLTGDRNTSGVQTHPAKGLGTSAYAKPA